MMFCFLYKRAISRSMDSDKPLGRLAARHVNRCSACGQFRSQCLALARELTDDARELAVDVSADRHAKILARCERANPPAVPAAADTQAALPSPSASARARGLASDARRLLLRPAAMWALAAAAVLVLAILAWRYYPRHQPPQTPKTPPPIVNKHKTEQPGPPPLELAIDLPAPSDSVAAIDQALGRRVEEELRLLREDGKAAAEFLLACVPLEIGLPKE